MIPTTLLIVLAIAVTLLFFYQLRIYAKFRGARVVICPETQAAAGCTVDARRAATTALLNTPELRLRSCSRWPERGDCGQECVRQIEAAPEDCLLRNILAHWYACKTCALCKEPFREIHWSDHKPALIDPQGELCEWGEVRGEDVFMVLDSHLPVCWRCYIVRTFCRQHPELVVNRSREWR